MRNRYTWLHTKLFFALLRKGKLTPRKLWNAFLCHWAYWFKTKRSARGPLMVSIELWNECNINCLFCRDQKGGIYDINPGGTKAPIAKGRMSFETFTKIIDQVKDYVLVAVLYTNGEPLMYKDLVKCVEYATKQGVATIIATNGTLLTEAKVRELMAAGIDFVKIQLSGYTQETYNVQVRNGDVEKIKEGITIFDRLNKVNGHPVLLLVDYISYQYNAHEFPLIEKFCEGKDVMLSRRPGNPSHGLEKTEPPLVKEPLPLKVSCDWLWKAMQVNWNGEILQCCEGVVFSDLKPYAKMNGGNTELLKIWNGDSALATRETMTTKGRGAMAICAGCSRQGISFKW